MLGLQLGFGHEFRGATPPLRFGWLYLVLISREHRTNAGLFASFLYHNCFCDCNAMLPEFFKGAPSMLKPHSACPESKYSL